MIKKDVSPEERQVIKFFLWEMVAMLWKKDVFSSPRWTHLIVFRCFQKILLDSMRDDKWVLTWLLKFDSNMDRALWSSSPSRRSRTQLQLWISLVRLDKLLLQDLSPALTSLNFAQIFLAALPKTGEFFQCSSTVSLKPGCWIQKFSNLKKLAFWNAAVNINHKGDVIWNRPS